MDVFHFAEFGRLKFAHHTIDTYLELQWTTAVSSEKADSVITHLLEVMDIVEIPVQVKIDYALAYNNIKHMTGIPHKPIGYATTEITLKDRCLENTKEE